MAKAKSPWLTRVAILVSLAAVALSIYRWRAARSKPSDLSAGGIELVYAVDADVAVQQKFNDAIDQLVRRLNEAGVTVTSVAPAIGSATVVSPNLLAKAPQVELALREAGLTQKAGGAANRMVVAFAPEQGPRIADAAMQQSARVVHDRIEKLVPVAPTVKQAEHKLVVGIPGVSAEQLSSIKEALAMPGRLELRLVDEGKTFEAVPLPAGGAVKLVVDEWSGGSGSHRAPLWEAADVATLEAARKQLPPVAVPGGVEPLIDTSEPGRARLRLVARGGIDGIYVSEAKVDREPATHRPMANVALDAKGTQLFETFTGDHVGRKLAIVLDGRVLMAPIIQARIAGGRAMITGGFSGDEAAQRRQFERLVLALNTGALPAPLTPLSERIIAPSPEAN